MPRKPKSSEPLVKITTRVYSSDYETLKEMYPQAGPQEAIRELIHAHIQLVRIRKSKEIEGLATEIDLELEEDV